MFIEELIIDGFKSYSTRVSVGPFDKQFNAITGLNGSGKSNILDSICFVLGISNLSHVRVGNLSELVYKQGQAGVTKATVTVIFNNDDRNGSPVGYEDQRKITITRQIVIGGRNRYILNSHTVQTNTIQNLFHSVSLNVNNPHFLIMQGRITKVINMKPQETLSMIEEAAGTRMYENKKAGALKTLEKKQNKVDEINRLLSEEITPTLEKLQRERANYMLWISNNNELERLARFCTAYEYLKLTSRLDNKNQQLEELENGLKQLAADLQALSAREFEAKKEMEERTKAKDTDKSRELKALEEEQSTILKDNAQTESKMKNAKADLEKQVETRNKSLAHLEGIRKQVADKDKVFQKEKGKFDALNDEDNKTKQEIEKAQWSMQALTAGMSTEEREEGETQGKSLREELLAAQTRHSEIESDHQKKSMSIAHLKQRIAATQQSANNCKQEGKKLAKEKSAIEGIIKQKEAELGKLRFNPEQFQELVQKARQAESNKYAIQERLDSLRASISGCDFQFCDPHRGFDRSKVKGVVAKLFHIKPDQASFARAMEIAAGGRLYNVIVDTEDTASKLLQHGQLRRRVTIIPLNKIQDHAIHPSVVKMAKSVAPQGAEVESALEIIGYDSEIHKAMRYVFGGTLVCDSPDVAKKVTFHPNVRVRTVTKQGDVYDPAGTVTGGSAPKGGNLLQSLQQLSTLEKQWEQQGWEYKKAKEQADQMQSMASKYRALEQELRVKQHEFALIEDRIKRSAHHATEQALEEMQTQVTQFEADLKALPEEKKELDKKMKQFEKDIKSLESSRGERIKYFERQVEELKAKKQQNVGKLEKQREKMESVGVELEVMRNELESQENQDNSSGQSHDALQKELDEMQAGMDQRQARLKVLNERLETLKNEIRNLDQTLGNLANELTVNKQQQEEKELEQKRLDHKIQQLAKDDQESQAQVERMEKEHPWIEKEKSFFGKAGTDFDFEANSYQDNKKRLDQLTNQQKKLSNNINKKAMAMFEKAEQEYKDLLHKRDTILNDKCKIEKVIKGLDEKKIETLRRTWAKVNKDFDSIFSTLLPHTNAKLEAPQGMDETEGLEIKVAFNGVWKQSLTELSGGQRSLLALSLVLALLLFKPAPMYILDEIDSALDLSHTQNIGHMIRTHFPHSQFIIVSLKEGMFNHANVLFRTRFIDGTSTVSRNAIRDENDRVKVPTKNNIESEKISGAPMAKKPRIEQA